MTLSIQSVTHSVQTQVTETISADHIFVSVSQKETRGDFQHVLLGLCGSNWNSAVTTLLENKASLSTGCHWNLTSFKMIMNNVTNLSYWVDVIPPTIKNISNPFFLLFGISCFAFMYCFSFLQWIHLQVCLLVYWVLIHNMDNYYKKIMCMGRKMEQETRS